MKWKKILSFAIVSVLVMSGLAVISGHTSAQDTGERITEINFGVQLDEEQGALNAAEGDTDLFMQSLDGPVWENLPDDVRASLDTWEVKGSYNNYFLNPAHEGWSTPEMEEAVDNGWIDDNESVKYLANNYDDEWTINPLAHNDVRFAFQYLDRESMIEDLLLGWGNPRYGPMAATSELWQEHFVEEVEDNYDVDPSGDWNYVEDFVQNGMDEISTYIEETHPEMGELTGDMDDGWYYNHPDQDEHQIEINIMARTEDWRQDKGDWTATRLEDLGFEVNVDPTDSASATPQAYYADPEPYDNLEYHIYTGGWVATTAVYYQEVAFSQMYAPWYGFMHTYGSDSHWQYDDEGYNQSIGPSDYVRNQLDIYEHENSTVADMDAVTSGIYSGEGLETSDDYWGDMVDSAQMGFEESIRVFTVTQVTLYPYNPDELKTAVPESINGYDTYFGPRSMRTTDGTLDTEILTGEDRPYMDNWNMEGGSSDVYGEYQRRVAREYGSWTHPETGEPMQVNNYWMNNTQLEEEKPERDHPYDINGSVEKDYEYNGTELEENIDVPDTAVDYVPSEEEWMNRTELYEAGLLEDNKSAVKVTMDPHLEHTWHDGTEMKFRDIMHYYARRKTLADESEEPFSQATYDLLNPFYETIDGIEWNADENTYTIYGDYTFPLDDKIGYHYDMYPWDGHPLTYTGWNQLHAGDDYSYDSEEGTDWIHQLSTEHSNDMIAALEDMDVPAYLDEANFTESMSSDLAMTQSEMDDIVSSFDDFVSETGHSYIGIGPYRIDEYDSENYDLTITQWDDYGYPQAGEEGPEGNTWENGYWSEQFEINQINVDFLELSPDEIMLYEQDADTTVNVSGQVTYEELFPDVSQRALEEGDYNDFYIVLAESERGPPVEGKTIESQDITLTDEGSYTSFEAEMDVSDIETSGQYSMEIWFEDAAGTMSTRARQLGIATEESYDLTIDVEGEGTTTPEVGTHEYSVLEEVEISAEPADAFGFDEWTGDVPYVEDATSENMTVTMDQDRNLTAHFSPLQEYNLTIGAGEGGTTDPEPGNHTYYEGEEVTVEAIPDEDMYFDEWTGDYESEDQEITFEVTENMEIMAHFTEEAPEYELTVDTEGNGTVDIDPDQDVYEQGTEVTLTAEPDEGWEFDEWQGTDETGEEITITMDEDKDITAVFVEEDDDDDDDDGDGVPGFTVMLLVISAIVAVAIYYNKTEQ
ncbi:MAG: InlB B-repeat-containing protein [Thermoplasmata archaeon]